MDKGGLESIPDGAFEDGEGSKWTTWARGSVIYMRECAPVFFGCCAQSGRELLLVSSGVLNLFTVVARGGGKGRV